MESRPVWMDDPAIAHISQEKLDFLQKLVFESRGLSQKELFSFLMSVMKKAKDNKIVFQEGEMNLLIETIKRYSSQEDMAKIEKILRTKGPAGLKR